MLRPTLLFSLALTFIATAHAGDGRLTPEELQQLLGHAAELNVTAPWSKSQAVLDELRPHLDQATDEQYADFHLLEARNQIIAGEMETGIESLVALLDRNLTPQQEVRANELAANAAIVSRRYEAAFGFLGQALALAGQMESPEQSANVFSLSAYLYAQVGQIDRAKEYGRIAVDHYARENQGRGKCVALQRLGFVHKVDEDFDGARRLYQQAREICRESDDQVLLGVVESGLADLFRRAGEYDLAEDLFGQSIPRLEAADYQTGIAEARLYRARLHQARRELDKVEVLLRSAVDQFEHNEAWDYLAEANRMLGEIAMARGELEQAVLHYQAETNARERFLDMDRARQLAYLEVEFDTRFKEQELALLREQARVRELQMETRKQQRSLEMFGYGIIGFLVVVLVLLLVHASRERRRYRHLSHHDGLTGLNNHTRFFKLADAALHVAQKSEKSFTLVLADIDFFKRVNDEHGHLTGDEVLRRVSARIRDVFAGHGIVGRIGGEEFAIALTGKSPGEVEALVNQLRRKLRVPRAKDEPVAVSMSFGLAEASRTSTLTELRERADLALYQAKNAGRDQLVFADARP